MSETSKAGLARSVLHSYLRGDGRKGIRNVVAVAYRVECVLHVAREIAAQFLEPLDSGDVFNEPPAGGRAARALDRLSGLLSEQPCREDDAASRHTSECWCRAVRIAGGESMNERYLVNAVRASGRPVELLTIQEEAGTRSTIQYRVDWVRNVRRLFAVECKAPMALHELVVGTVCDGSDGTNGVTANPAVGRASVRLIDAGVTCLFEDNGELIGCEFHMKRRAVCADLGDAIIACVEEAARYYSTFGHGSFAAGNADGELATQEKRSPGAYAKSDVSPIVGIVEPGDVPSEGRLYLLDVVPDGEPRFSFPNISDNAEIAQLIARGAHVILFTAGRESLVGSAISPVNKVWANSATYRNLAGDMDIDAGRILEGRGTLGEVGREVFERTMAVARSAASKSETFGHQEFTLAYKSFDPNGPDCLPSNVGVVQHAVEIASYRGNAHAH
ncbi:D-galactarate dehydratase [Burkholderia pseudomallei]|nr:UxaA family hydrolase [Burkholderia pseudomallei]ONB97139.1 D-galactarate dehydratase [Burkholderia pseudomallei]